MPICIDRCICFQRTFAELKIIAAEKKIETLTELQQAVEFGKKCRLCHPYVQRMLQTGETVFDQIIQS